KKTRKSGQEKKPKADKSVSEKVELSTRTKKALKQSKMSLKEAKGMKKAELLEIKGIGEKSAEEILNA
ncbi:hypothetical protein GF389_05040, partial [Candidatus Dojkabacteria bacterium]|nr:hypothetical protein [Candidatus Dojkabacteria bacterium]